MLLRHWLLRHLFFFNDTATTEIYTLSLHDALPIFALWKQDPQHQEKLFILGTGTEQPNLEALSKSLSLESEIKRSEEHTSELQSRQYLVCRLLLEKNK